jgi:type IV secretion/conjugal transfer VirB4 family ATPase
MIRLKRVLKDYEDSGALHARIGVQEAVDDHSFLTKSGDLFTVLRVGGIDDECLDPHQADHIANRIEAAFHILDENIRLYQYLLKSDAKPIEYGPSGQQVVQEALTKRADHLNTKRLYTMEIFWAVAYEDCRFNRNRSATASSLFSAHVAQIKMLLSDKSKREDLSCELSRARQVLTQAVNGLTIQLQDVLPLTRLSKHDAFLFLRRLVNAAPHKIAGPDLAFDQFIDYQLCDSTLECERDHLRLDESFVKVLTLRDLPPNTSAHLFRDLETIPGNLIIVTEWQRERNDKMRRQIATKRRHFHNSKASLMNYIGPEPSKPSDMLINEGAAAMVRDLGEAQQELEMSGHHFGRFSITAILFGESLDEVRRAASECYKVFASKGAHLTDESYNLLNAFLAVVPGSSSLNVRRLWISSANAADLASVFVPSVGEARNAFLNVEHLATLETRQATPYFLNLHRGDVPHALILGSTGSGKSFLLNFLIMQSQKYGPNTFIFDLGGGYKSLTALCNGVYLGIGADFSGIKINPFCLPPTKDNVQFLCSFVRVLAESSGYRLTTQDETDLYSQIVNIYEIDPEQRRLGTLANILNRPLGETLLKWIKGGQYGQLFDNTEDTLTFARFQAFDFESSVPEVLEPLLFYVLHRANVAICDAANTATLKIFVIDEAWKFLRNPVTRDYISEALKTWRKKNAAMILATQSIDDLLHSEMLATVLESCPTKFFLANPDMDAKACAKIFQLNEAETRAIRSLVPKRELLLKRADFAKVLTLDVDSKSYWLYTNNPYDNQRKEEAIGRLGLTEGLEFLSKEKSQ